ncbi:MAG: single-stranded DNA-binding protein [Ktedonobacterales bacterium]|nr:single-stranded DNA-binding protein [Ktedonobacterales bacterium]
MLNKIMLIGNLGRDPEMSYTPAGKAITKFSLAVNRRSKDRETGERREETTWFSIVAWENLAETCNTYLRKGSKVYIEGRMTSRKYTNKDGVEVTAWDVVANDMEMLDPKSDSQGQQNRGGRGDSTGEMQPDDIPF